MWITRIKIKHDCIIGNRCEKFNVTTIGISFNVFRERRITYSPQIQTIHGEEKNIRKFIKDLRKDNRIKNLEVEGNTIFLIEVRKEKIPASFYHSKLIHVKPVFVDTKGYEFWEVASWHKSILLEFIKHLERNIKNVEVLKIQQTNLTDIYFSRLMPKLTQNQKVVIELAFERGYYKWPKKTNFGELSKLRGISISTFREHLKRAEEKLMPNLMNSIN